MEYYLNYRTLAQAVLEEENINMCPRGHSCGILVKNMAAFCPCLKSLSELQVKRFGLVPLAEEIFKQSSVVSILWLLVVMVMKIYNEKEQAE